MLYYCIVLYCIVSRPGVQVHRVYTAETAGVTCCSPQRHLHAGSAVAGTAGTCTGNVCKVMPNSTMLCPEELAGSRALKILRALCRASAPRHTQTPPPI